MRETATRARESWPPACSRVQPRPCWRDLVVAAAHAKGGVKMGEGRHTYEWVPGWLKLPPGMNVGQTHGDVVIDSQDRIYFSVDTGNSLFEVDTDGRIARVFGQALGGGVHGMRLVKEPDGREVIWIAHLNRHEVLKISLGGEILMTIPFPDKNGMYKEAKEYVPTALDVAPNGDVYVVDGYGRNWLHRFNAKGRVRAVVERDGGGGAVPGAPRRGARPAGGRAARRRCRSAQSPLAALHPRRQVRGQGGEGPAPSLEGRHAGEGPAGRRSRRAGHDLRRALRGSGAARRQPEPGAARASTPCRRRTGGRASSSHPTARPGTRKATCTWPNGTPSVGSASLPANSPGSERAYSAEAP